MEALKAEAGGGLLVFRYASTAAFWYDGMGKVQEKPPPLPPHGVGVDGAGAEKARE